MEEAERKVDMFIALKERNWELLAKVKQLQREVNRLTLQLEEKGADKVCAILKPMKRKEDVGDNNMEENT